MTKWVKTAEYALDVAGAALRGEAVTVQVRAVHVEPYLGALDVRIEALHQPPEPQRVVKLHEMTHLVRGEVVEHERGRENEPPRERQYARVRARAPAARLVAHVDALDGNAELGRVAPARGLEIALRLALEEVAGAAVDVRRLARNAQEPVAGFVRLGPHRAAHAAAIDDAMRLAAQRHLDAVRERCRCRQALEPRGDPAAVLLRELFRLLEAAARRHGENHLAGGGVDAQRIASRLAMPAQAHEINRFVENDLNNRGLARTAIEQRAQRHGSTLEQPRRKYCHMSKRAQHDGQQIKALPLAAGLVVIADHNSLGALKI